MAKKTDVAAGWIARGALRFRSGDPGLYVDSSKLEAPDRVYDADVAWIEHNPGETSMVFVKLDAGGAGVGRSRLQIRMPPEDLAGAFWRITEAFYSRLEKFVARWQLPPVDAGRNNRPAVPMEARQHSEWAN